MSRRVSQSFTQSFTELYFTESAFCETLPTGRQVCDFISENLREKKYFSITSYEGIEFIKITQKTQFAI